MAIPDFFQNMMSLCFTMSPQCASVDFYELESFKKKKNSMASTGRKKMCLERIQLELKNKLLVLGNK